MTDRADPGRSVHTQPDVALFAHRRLAGVQTHAHSNLSIVRPPVPGKLALGDDGGRDG